MALVNPNIAMSFRQPEFTPRNALAEYAQIQQIQGGQRQAEIADMQLRRMRQEDEDIERIHQIAMKNGGPDSRMEMGRALFASRNKDQRELGYKIIQHEEAVRAYNSEFGPGGAAAPSMPKSAPGTMAMPAELAAGAQPEPMTPVPGVISTSRVPGVTTAPITAPKGTMREIAPGGAMGAEMPLAQANTLAPPAAAPVNAMLAAQPTAPAAPNIDALRRQYGMAVAAGRSDAPVLLKQIEAALRGDQNRPLAVSRGQVVIDPRTGQQIFAAPAAPRPEAAPRTQQVTMSDGTLGIVNMDTGVITPSTVDGVPVKGKANKDLAVSEQQASYNLGRILDAAKEINAALKKDPNALKPGVGEASAASVGLSGTANVARSAQRQIVYGAQRDALDAMLYLATGAAYNKEQLEGQMAAYVPAFTDKPDAVEAKRVRMLGLIQNAKVRAGKAWTPEMDAASQALLLPVASSAKPVGGNKPPAAPGASNVTQDRADANAAIAAGAPADAVRARFKQRTGQEL